MAEREEVYGFDRADADELVKLLGNRPTQKNPQDVYDATRIVLVHTALGATARSSTTLGTGVGTLRYLAVSGADRVITASANTDDITYFNLSTLAVGGDKYLMLLRYGDVYLANWEEC